MKTKEKLAEVLLAHKLYGLERAARRGRFDDFESESATPIADLVRYLQEAGHDDLAKRAIEGEWDCTREESEAWAASPEGRETIGQLLKK